MPNFDESVINFAVYEDGVEYVGMAGVTLPNLSAIVQTLSGAGIAGNVEVPVLGHYDVMSLGLNFRTTTEQSVRLSEPRRPRCPRSAALRAGRCCGGGARRGARSARWWCGN